MRSRLAAIFAAWASFMAPLRSAMASLDPALGTLYSAYSFASGSQAMSKGSSNCFEPSAATSGALCSTTSTWASFALNCSFAAARSIMSIWQLRQPK